MLCQLSYIKPAMMCASSRFVPFGHEMLHTTYLSPAGYSVVLQDRWANRGFAVTLHFNPPTSGTETAPSIAVSDYLFLPFTSHDSECCMLEEGCYSFSSPTSVPGHAGS